MSTMPQNVQSVTVTQVIPPEKHGKYALGDDLVEAAAGKYVLTMELPEKKPGSRWERFKISWSSWVSDPSSTTEWVLHAISAVEFDEGEHAEVAVEETEVPDVYEVVEVRSRGR